MKTWSHILNLTTVSLEPELNAYAEQGYEIFRLWKDGHEKYEIVIFKEITSKNDVTNGYDDLGNPIKYGVS